MLHFPKFLPFLVVLFVGAFPQPLVAQKPTLTVGRIALRSGYIFAGTVLAIDRIAGGGSAVDSVQITFRVERGVRGVRSGETLTIREWSGLWLSGERYRRGQQVVLFLYGPSKLGLTSTVAGSQERLSIDHGGRVTLPLELAAQLAGRTSFQSQKNRVSLHNFAQALRRSEEK